MGVSLAPVEIIQLRRSPPHWRTHHIEVMIVGPDFEAQSLCHRCHGCIDQRDHLI
jgi:hypothetical protein